MQQLWLGDHRKSLDDLNYRELSPICEVAHHVRAVADLLGHSSFAITGDIYSDTSDETARAAVNGLSGALGL